VRAWVFTEMPYPFIPPADTFASARVLLPNRVYDPEVGYELYKRYFEIYELADRLGMDIMLNEHHSTPTCVEPAVPLTMSILARTTSRARLLALGNPVANRREPVRIAEEMAMVDVISQGRAEVGFVRGVPMELSAVNSNPVLQKDRMWEAVDLIVKAWTTHDGPFSWEGEFFHHRQVNIWPRPYQSPHPPIWIPTQTRSTAADAAARGYTLATILNGVDGCSAIFEAYRERYEAVHGTQPAADRLAYLGLVYVAEREDDARAGARKLQWYLQNNKVAPQFANVAGYVDAKARAHMLSQQAATGALLSPIEHLAYASIEDLTKDGYFFVGQPMEVVEQIVTFHERVGGFGNLLMMVQAGTMTTDLVAPSMQLLADVVLPEVRRRLGAGTASP
jgi:alkanesulfonate monooxygenase SsuD/methylene tetrahydromethanopterin reductase-like flavin-dependent oxidoreductase (luciferase family)